MSQRRALAGYAAESMTLRPIVRYRDPGLRFGHSL
jgi:hypothetical protein